MSEKNENDAVEMFDPTSIVADDTGVESAIAATTAENIAADEESEGGAELSGKGPELVAIADSIEDFNPMDIVDGINGDDENEGGISRNKSTHHNLSTGNEGSMIAVREGSLKDLGDKFELSGFNIISDAYKTEYKPVNMIFSNIDSAKAAVNGSKYIYVDDGELVTAEIVSGTPSISDDEVELFTHVDGEWRRL
jgi:hypothetical protein